MIPRKPRRMWLSTGSLDTEPTFRNTIDPTCANTPASASNKSSCAAAGTSTLRRAGRLRDSAALQGWERLQELVEEERCDPTWRV